MPGLGAAPVYPAIIHSTPTNFGVNNSQAIIGIQMASAYTGSTVMPPLFGALGSWIGMWILPHILFILFILFVIRGIINFARFRAEQATASVFINDDESGLHQDYEEWLEKLAPHEPISKYRHNRTGEDNGDAHLKRQVMGREVVAAVTNGKLDFGPWEQIFYGEFDGGRRKRVLVKIIGE